VPPKRREIPKKRRHIPQLNLSYAKIWGMAELLLHVLWVKLYWYHNKCSVKKQTSLTSNLSPSHKERRKHAWQKLAYRLS
jgi:hypothetical protein